MPTNHHEFLIHTFQIPRKYCKQLIAPQRGNPCSSSKCVLLTSTTPRPLLPHCFALGTQAFRTHIVCVNIHLACPLLSTVLTLTLSTVQYDNFSITYASSIPESSVQGLSVFHRKFVSHEDSCIAWKGIPSVQQVSTS